MIRSLIFISLLVACSGETNAPSNPELITKKDEVGSVQADSIYLSYSIAPNEANIAMYWQTSTGEPIKSFARLKSQVEKQNQNLVFATNGGMYTTLFAPLGLYIEKGELIAPLDTFTNREGNFYMLPNGVFSITKSGIPKVQPTSSFQLSDSINFATQSGPMLLIDGEIHPDFKQGSTYINRRNGVGVLPSGDLIFVMSKTEVNLYDFAHYFQERGCDNALYLDGFISRTYCPQANWTAEDGKFGVIIAVTQSR